MEGEVLDVDIASKGDGRFRNEMSREGRDEAGDGGD